MNLCTVIKDKMSNYNPRQNDIWAFRLLVVVVDVVDVVAFVFFVLICLWFQSQRSCKWYNKVYEIMFILSMCL
jgi:hypothetical protein